MAGWLRWLRTIRYLRPVQIYGRVVFRLARPAIDTSLAPPLRPMSGTWAVPAMRRPSLLHPWRFRFLNETHAVDSVNDWDNPSWSKLWRYNLHYFDDLNSVQAASRSEWHRQWMERWVLENPPAKGSAWEPYPTSLRIVNWVKWALAGNRLPDTARQSLAVQTRWLTRRIEYHLLGNHLFSNAKALVFAGLFFTGGEAEGWLATGLRILKREVQEQILPDGGQFERSPMYHALALEDMLDLVNVTRVYPEVASNARWRDLIDAWPLRAAAMRYWLMVMCHPDGEISFFNDSAIGIAPAPADLGRYGASILVSAEELKPEDKVAHLGDSGYVRVGLGPMVALLDVAPIGPDYLPGHAHADTLSFECSLFGQRLVVNSGTSVYGIGAERLRQRGTPAHSTVTLDSEDSSEVWAGFRVARRAGPFGLAVQDKKDAVLVRCAHDGYRRFSRGAVHERRWHFTQSSMSITDIIDGRFGEAIARFYVHPLVTVTVDDGENAGWFSLSGGQRCRWRVDGGAATLVDGSWHPEFGVVVPNRCLLVQFAGKRCQVTFDWG